MVLPPIFAMKNHEGLIYRDESLAKALVTKILEFYTTQSNTIYVISSGLARLDQTYSTILTRIYATIDKTLAITIHILMK